MHAIFVSDLHLAAQRPVMAAAFTRLLRSEARQAAQLYILGDLFDYWIGDDDLADPLHAGVAAEQSALATSGCRVFFMPGNRDFLLGPRFCEATGTRLLGDYERITLDGQPVLLTHGDLLCTDDTRYMTLRAELRSKSWQRDFLARPLAERRQIASDLRQLSATEVAAKDDYIMDVNQGAVERTMREHDVTLLVHGHTHRPAVHRFSLDGRPAARIVLGAWYHDPSFMRWTEAKFALEQLD